MPSAIPNDAKRRILDAYINGTDIRVALLMSNTTADTEVDAIVNIDDYTTLDECDDSTYARVALASEAVAADDANNRAEFDATDSSFTGLTGDSTRTIVGALILEHVDGTAANDIPLFYSEFASPLPATATQVDLPWNTEGIAQLS